MHGKKNIKTRHYVCLLRGTISVFIWSSGKSPVRRDRALQHANFQHFVFENTPKNEGC